MRKSLSRWISVTIGLTFAGHAHAATVTPDQLAQLGRAAAVGDMRVLANIAGLGCALTDATTPPEERKVEERLKLYTEIKQCISIFGAQAVAAADPDQLVGQKFSVDATLAAVEAKRQAAEAEVDFLDLSWGLGFGYSFGFDDAVDEASVVNGVVRVQSEKRDQPRMLFEFHKFFWCNDRGTNGTRGCGPFVAVAATNEDALSGVGMGLMYGRKSKVADSTGFSIGVGAILDADVADLADGFKANQAPPDGEDTVRLETKSRWSAVVFVTRTFDFD